LCHDAGVRLVVESARSERFRVSRTTSRDLETAERVLHRSGDA
jgi:hypothetical protein